MGTAPLAAAEPVAPRPDPVAGPPAYPPAYPGMYQDAGEPEAVGAGFNPFQAIRRRWPLVALMAAAGLVFGFLWHNLQSPTYQSTAQLLVIKKNPTMLSGSGGADSRVAFLEDYVATQVTLLKSESILLLAAQKLNERPLQVPAPDSPRERVAVLGGGLAVAREKEPGSGAPSNILAISFRGPNAADAPQYLDSLIDAYRAQLAVLYDEATTQKLEALDRQIKEFRNKKAALGVTRDWRLRELRAISHEETASLRSRISSNRTTQSALKLKQAVIDSQLALISQAVVNRSTRRQVMAMLNVQSRQANLSPSDPNNPEGAAYLLELQKADLVTRLGKDHPEVQAIDGRIRMLKELIAKFNPDTKENLDELALHELVLKQERAATQVQLTEVSHSITQDEDKVSRMTMLQDEVDGLGAQQAGLEKEIQERDKDKLATEASRSGGGYDARVITKPAAGYQVKPVLTQSLAFGLLLGLIAGCGLASLAELTDRSFRSPAEIRRRLGLPVLGHVPPIRTGLPSERDAPSRLDPTLVGFLRPKSTEAEAYRGVRTQLYFSTQGRGHQVIQVTSPNPGDGKSTLAANLAVSIAQSGKRVVLVDCDFRKPRVHKLFDLPNPDVGLASVMAGDTSLDAAVRPCEVPNLSILPCGPRPANPAELLTSPSFADVLADLRGRFDFVVVDTPPVLAVSETAAVAARVDGVLLVFRMTKMARPMAERAREQLAAVGARMVGVVINGSAPKAEGGGYAYGYAYRYDADYDYAEDYADDEPAAPPPRG